MKTGAKLLLAAGAVATIGALAVGGRRRTAAGAVTSSSRGDGIFTVGYLPRSDAFASWVTTSPYRWVSPQGFVLRPGKSAVFYGPWLRGAAQRLEDGGRALYPWVWPQPGKVAEFWARCQELVALGCKGVLVDAERPYYAMGKAGGITKSGAAAAMAELMGARPGGLEIGLLTYGAPPSYHPGFPWAEYRGGDWVLPMVYRSSNKAVRQTVDAQSKYYQGADFTPVLSIDYSHKLGALRAAAAQTRQVYGSVAIWHYGYVRSRGVSV